MKALKTYPEGTPVTGKVGRTAATSEAPWPQQPRAWAGAPAEAVKRLNEELTAIASMADVRDRLKDLGVAAQNSTPAQFADLIRSETEKVARIVKDARIKFE